MTVAHEAVTAYPVVGDPDKATIRDLLTKRFAYALAASESSTDLNVVDPDSGAVPLYLLKYGTLFAYDATDGTSTHDDATCLVSADGKRFKSGTIDVPYSVLTYSTTAQPVSPSDGDAYLLPVGATGADWAGNAGKIGIYKGLRWHFAIVPIGRFIYVKDVTGFYHRNTSGVWTAGTGSLTLGAASLNITHILGANASFTVKVENQTTNAEPASPVTPTAYIIGPSPTGTHWAGNAGKLAICLSTGVWTIITPVDGDTVYDKTTKASYRYSSATSSWVSSAGAWTRFTSSGLQSAPTVTNAGSGGYTPSGTAPTTSQLHSRDDTTQLTYAARVSGIKLRLRYTATLSQSSSASQTPAFFRDSDANAIYWSNYVGLNGSFYLNFEYVFDSVDTSSHTYKFRVVQPAGGSNVGILRATMTIEEGGA